MLMPEAASYLYDFPMSWQHHVWLAGEVFAMEAETVAEGMDKATDDDLGFGIFSPHECHLRAASGIGHGFFESASTWPG